MAEIFTPIMTQVDALTVNYIAEKTKIVATAMKPAAITCMGIYAIMMSFAYLRNDVREPITTFALKLLKMVVVYFVAINLWSYNQIVVDTMLRSPELLAQAMAGGNVGSTSTSLDKILSDLWAVGDVFYEKGGLFSGSVGAYLAAFFVWIAGLCVTGYAGFLIVLSKIFLSVLIALGPLFILGLFFEPTSRFFESWVAYLANFALIAVLTAGINLFILSMFQDSAAQVAALGENVSTGNLPVICVLAIISMLALGQVPQVAAGVAGGIAMSSYGVGRMIAKSTTAPARALGRATKEGAKQGARKVARKAVSAYKSRRNKIENTEKAA